MAPRGLLSGWPGSWWGLLQCTHWIFKALQGLSRENNSENLLHLKALSPGGSAANSKDAVSPELEGRVHRARAARTEDSHRAPDGLAWGPARSF